MSTSERYRERRLEEPNIDGARERERERERGKVKTVRYYRKVSKLVRMGKNVWIRVFPRLIRAKGNN